MDIQTIRKEYEEEIVLEDYSSVRIRNIVEGTLSKEEQEGGPKVLMERSDKLFQIAKKLTERDIKTFRKERQKKEI